MNDLSQLKQSIIDISREMVRLGLTLGTWGNISILAPDRGSVVITPSGMNYDIITAEDMVIVDLSSGRITEGNRRPSIETPLHLAIYRKRTDVNAVVHTHSLFATAAAVARTPIPAVVEDMAQAVGGSVEVAGYALPGTDELAGNVIAALATRNAVLMANHGMVGVGPTVSDAFQVCQVVEKTARIYAYAKLYGDPVILSDDDIREMHRFFTNKYRQK